MVERLVDILNDRGTVIHTFPITVPTAGKLSADEDCFKDKALRASAYAEIVPDSELASLTAKMHVCRAGSLEPYGDQQAVLSQTKGSLDEGVRQRAYQLWELDGRPDGQSDDYWFRAQDEHLRERAYVQWRQEGHPDGEAEEHWHMTKEFGAY
jgi:hypothetical protein